MKKIAWVFAALAVLMFAAPVSASAATVVAKI